MSTSCYGCYQSNIVPRRGIHITKVSKQAIYTEMIQHLEHQRKPAHPIQLFKINLKLLIIPGHCFPVKAPVVSK